MTPKQIQSRRDKLRRGFKVTDLTVTQTDVLRYALECWLSGFLPTIREICSEFGWSSPNAAATHLAALRQKGYVETQDSDKASLMLSDKSLELVL